MHKLMWLKLTKTTMEGEDRKVLVRIDSPIRIEEVKFKNSNLRPSVIRWLPQGERGEAIDEKPLFVLESVEEIWAMIQGNAPARPRKLRKNTG